MTGYLERAGIARELKALLLGARSPAATPVRDATAGLETIPARPAGPDRPEAWHAG